MARKKQSPRSRPDYYAKKAKKDRYPARSVYKLKEMQEKYRLIKKGDRVLDLGCAPGSWMLYAAECTGKSGFVAGVDLKPVTERLPAHCRVYAGDVTAIQALPKRSDPDAFSPLTPTFADPAGKNQPEGLPQNLMDEWLQTRYNIVLSDMAPATTGIKDVDAARSHDLCNTALDIAERVLRTGGSFVCKIFQGEAFKPFSEAVKARFDRHKIFKPRTCRSESREIYLIGTGKKQEE